MNFEEELKEILDRYVPLGDNKEQHENAVKILTIRITDLYEKCKEEAQ